MKIAIFFFCNPLKKFAFLPRPFEEIRVITAIIWRVFSQFFVKIIEFFSRSFNIIRVFYATVWWNWRFLRDPLLRFSLFTQSFDEVRVFSWLFDEIFIIFVILRWNLHSLTKFAFSPRYLRQNLKIFLQTIDET